MRTDVGHHLSAALVCASTSKAWSCSGRSASSHRRPESDSSENFVESVPAAYNAHNYAYPRYGTRRNHTRAGHCSSSRGVRSRTDARRGSSHRWPADPVESCGYHLNCGFVTACAGNRSHTHRAEHQALPRAVRSCVLRSGILRFLRRRRRRIGAPVVLEPHLDRLFLRVHPAELSELVGTSPR